MRYELEGWRVARRGDYRVTFRLEEEQHTIVVGRIEHRRDVYRRHQLEIADERQHPRHGPL